MTRHVFLASVGLSLPVVTESLWALMTPAHGDDAARPPVHPDVVHVVTTAPHGPRPRLAEFERRRDLLRARVAELYAQHGRAAPEFRFEAVADAQAEDGIPLLADVRDQRENILYANHVTRLVREYCADPDTVLHMSLAGGRKTMSSYDHAAMMFFGRVQDDMSHVLVTPPILERAGERFWWPGQPEARITVPGPGGDMVEVATTPDAARVDLVPVPFVRLGVRLPSGIPPEAEDYRELIEFIAFERGGGVLEVDAGSLSIRFGRRQVKLTRTYFALFAVFAIARKMGWPGFGASEEGAGANTAGFFPLTDLQAGLCGDARQPVRNDTQALRCFRALLSDERFRHGEDGTRLLDRIDQARLDGRGRVVRDGRTVDPTATYRANLARQLKQGVGCPYTLRWLTPEVWEAEDGRSIIGLPVPPDRIRLVGFWPNQLNPREGGT